MNKNFTINNVGLYLTKRRTLTALICCLGLNLFGQQTIQQTLSLKGNGVNSTEILFYKQDNANYWDLYANSNGFGLYNSDTNSTTLYINQYNNVGIGTISPKEKLSVNGKIRAHEIKVETANWPDYVFDQDYKILGLPELDAYIKANKHLPEMPSVTDAEKNGIELGEMNKLLLKKVEELTLHLIDKDKQILEDRKVIKLLEGRMKLIEEKLKIK